MKSARCLSSLLLLLVVPACGTIHEWTELKSAPMTFGECYDGITFVAKNGGFAPDVPSCDRGNGIYQSRWRFRQLGLGRPGRYRLIAEVLLDEGSAKDGWPIRFVVEQQKVKDLRDALEPKEEDWSDDGQDSEAETIFGEKLSRRLSPKI
jgi:hypothetical protein